MSNIMTSTLTQKGQVTIPKSFRDYLGIAPGDPIAFYINDRGEVTVKGAQSCLKPLPMEAQALSFQERVKSVVGVVEPNGMTTDEYMAWLRGEA
jgi:antitoxin PrlF